MTDHHLPALGPDGDLARELENFQQIASSVLPPPGEIPRLPGLDIHGRMLPLNGIVGGDHIVYVDFNRRFDLDRRLEKATDPQVRANLAKGRTRAGLLLADVAGHQITDATVHIGLHHAFLTGVSYELEMHGEVTTGLFEKLNTRFYQTANFSKFISVIYGEIAQNGDFTFLNAGSPPPVVFSREFGRLADINADRLTSFYPIGLFPSEQNLDHSRVEAPLTKKPFTTNRLTLLSPGDILLLYSDGLLDHARGEEAYFPGRLEEVLRETRDLTAAGICDAVAADLGRFAPAADDISLIVVKRN
ncbi:MAG: serine/threonine-protein phosphatase [bacterium]|jgi:serine phosphatase RsbU (regulator of sigma subunit)|nr:serine/threonine-protein phosphatase [bacterium]MBK7189399.1 serine/threonine-protein phosphatase [bacterium]MBK7672394.1 serine/threonine-protein phosphatase [bacterium]MBK7769777.1 serine/threonine-protein phosphatase [bacterium]MBK9775940.1 serine/threonine-protein phosphatase [bacterium]